MLLENRRITYGIHYVSDVLLFVLYALELQLGVDLLVQGGWHFLLLLLDYVFVDQFGPLLQVQSAFWLLVLVILLTTSQLLMQLLFLQFKSEFARAVAVPAPGSQLSGGPIGGPNVCFLF